MVEDDSGKSDHLEAKRQCFATDCGRPLRRIFTNCEKRGLWGGIFEDFDLNAVDFSGADLRHARFVRMSLRGCDFSGSDLRDAEFIECDIREASFAGAILGSGGRFDHSCFASSSGLSDRIRSYIRGRGGSFWCC